MGIKYFCVYDSNKKVTAVYYDMESMGDLIGVVVDELPSPEQNGLEPVLKINLVNNALYYDYVEVQKVTPIVTQLKDLVEQLETVQGALDALLMGGVQ